MKYFMNTLCLVLFSLLCYTNSYAYSNADVKCLSTAIFHEASTEPILGQIAVAQVIVNRVKNANRPNSICKVVKQPNQFPWYHKGVFAEKTSIPYESLSRAVLEGLFTDETKGAEYFHTKRPVRPKWTAGLRRTCTIGSHIFYRERLA